MQGTWEGTYGNNFTAIWIFSGQRFTYKENFLGNESVINGSYNVSMNTPYISLMPEEDVESNEIPYLSYSIDGGDMSLYSGATKLSKVSEDAKSSNETKIEEALSQMSIGFNLNSAGGIDLRFFCRNISSESIKYIRFNVELYNAVGDPINDDITGDHYEKVEIIGPVEPGEDKDTLGENFIIGYCENLTIIRVRDITVVYMDGTEETKEIDYTSKNEYATKNVR